MVLKLEIFKIIDFQFQEKIILLFQYFAKIHLLNHATLDNLRTAMTEGNCKLLSVTEQPPSESLQKGRGLMLPDDPIALQTKIYKSDEKCAAFLFPFKNYIFDPLVVKERIHTLRELPYI